MHIPYWDLRCEKCNEWQKENYGCEKDSVTGGFWELRGEKLLRCPIKLVTTQTNRYITAYNLINLNKWPYNKGWLQHSNKFIEAMQIIDTEIKKLEIQAMKAQKNG